MKKERTGGEPWMVVGVLIIIICALLVALSASYRLRGIPEKMAEATQQMKAALPKLPAEIIELAE